MNKKQREVMKRCFSAAYHSTKNKKPLMDLLDLQEFNGLNVHKG